MTITAADLRGRTFDEAMDYVNRSLTHPGYGVTFTEEGWREIAHIVELTIRSMNHEAGMYIKQRDEAHSEGLSQGRRLGYEAGYQAGWEDRVED